MTPTSLATLHRADSQARRAASPPRAGEIGDAVATPPLPPPPPPAALAPSRAVAGRTEPQAAGREPGILTILRDIYARETRGARRRRCATSSGARGAAARAACAARGALSRLPHAVRQLEDGRSAPRIRLAEPLDHWLAAFRRGLGLQRTRTCRAEESRRISIAAHDDAHAKSVASPTRSRCSEATSCSRWPSGVLDAASSATRPRARRSRHRRRRPLPHRTRPAGARQSASQHRPAGRRRRSTSIPESPRSSPTKPPS